MSRRAHRTRSRTPGNMKSGSSRTIGRDGNAQNGLVVDNEAEYDIEVARLISSIYSLSGMVHYDNVLIYPFIVCLSPLGALITRIDNPRLVSFIKSSSLQSQVVQTYLGSPTTSNQSRNSYDLLHNDGVLSVTPSYSEDNIHGFDFSLGSFRNVNLLEDLISSMRNPLIRKLNIIQYNFNMGDCLRVRDWGKTLTHLNLYGNNIGSIGLQVLAASLTHMPMLIYLNISSNRVLDEYRERCRVYGRYNLQGFEEFMAALSTNKQLKYIDVTHNNLGGLYDQQTYEVALNRDVLIDRAFNVARIISHSLLKNAHILSFDITNNNFPMTDQIKQSLSPCIRPVNLSNQIHSRTANSTDGYLSNEISFEVVSLCGNYKDCSVIKFHSFAELNPLHDDTELIDLSEKDLLPVDGHLLGLELRYKKDPFILKLHWNSHFGDDGVNAFVRAYLSENDAFQSSLFKIHEYEYASATTSSSNQSSMVYTQSNNLSQHFNAEITTLKETSVTISTSSASSAHKPSGDVPFIGNNSSTPHSNDVSMSPIRLLSQEFSSQSPLLIKLEATLNIRGLILTQCGLSALSLRYLRPLLMKNCLIELDISDNPKIISSKLVDERLKSFYLPKSPSLKKFRATNITSESVTHSNIFSALKVRQHRKVAQHLGYACTQCYHKSLP